MTVVDLHPSPARRVDLDQLDQVDQVDQLDPDDPSEIERLRERLRRSEARCWELEQGLAALAHGRADVLVLEGHAHGADPQARDHQALDAPYRAMTEAMSDGLSQPPAAEGLSQPPAAEGLLMLAGREGARADTITWANRAAAELLGVPLARLIGARLFELGRLANHQPRRGWGEVRPHESEAREDGPSRRSAGEDGIGESWAELLNELASSPKGPTGLDSELARLELPFPDNRLQLTISPLASGPFVALLTDVGKRERHTQLLGSEQVTAAILENVADAVIVCDLEGRIVRANRAAEEFCLGVPRGRMFETAVPLQLAAPGGRRSLLAEVLAGAEVNRVDARIPGLNGRSRDVVVSIRRLEEPTGTALGCVVTLTDISAHKRSEDFLRRSEQRFRTSVEAMLDCFGVYACERDEQGEVLDFVVAYLNAAARRDDRVGAGQQVGARLRGSNPSRSDDARLHAVFCSVVADQREFAGDVSVADPSEPDGQRRYELRVAPLDDGCVAVWRDVSRERRLEADLLASEERFLFAARGTKMAIWDWDLQTQRVTWFGAPEALFGASPGEMPDGRYRSLIDPELGAEQNAAVHELLASGGSIWKAEFPVRRVDGERVWISARGEVIRDSQGQPVRMVGLSFDITERKAAELRQAEYERQLAQHRDRLQELVAERTAELARTHERLRMSERMASIGTLSAGLGHDMGNILLPIRARLDTIEARGEARSLDEDLGAIRASVVYLQKLASGLRMLALDPDESDASSSTTSLAQWWGEFDRLLANCLPKRVQLIDELPPNLPPIRLARHRLTQLVFNLVQNAGNAMRDSRGTRVRLVAEPVYDDTGTIVRVRLQVEDDGPGMTEEVRRRCLEPFFTTRTRRYSTGLGLTLAHGIVTQAGGTMQLDSELDVGTCFTIELPVATLDSEAKLQPTLVSVTLADARMRAYAGSLLRNLGTQVEYVAPGEHTGVWLGDGESEAELLRFLDGDERRAALVLSSSDIEHPRLTKLRAPVRPADLRAALWRVIRLAQSHPTPLTAPPSGSQ